MNLKEFYKKSIGIIAVIAIGVFGGPNKDVRIIIDHDALTKKIESVCSSSGIDVLVAVKVSGATNLAGFCITATYDTTQLKFVSAMMVKEGASGPSFLESEGGKAGPFMVIPKEGKVEVVAGIKTKGGDEAPDGEGILAYLKFERCGSQECAITVIKAELSDSNLIIDKIIFE